MAVWATKLFYDLRNNELEKLIFTATTGRSGTTSLTALFAAVPGSVSYHEPYPIMNGEWLHKASYGEIAEVEAYFRKVKSIYIRRAAAGARYYLEANHLFIKTFIAAALEEFGSKIEIIHLVRPAAEVAESIYRIRNWPGTADGNKWWLDYRAPNNLIPVADLLDADPALSHPFYKALWYWYEAEARIERWKLLCPAARFHRFETAWFNDFSRASALLDGLGVCYDSQTLKGLIGTKMNDIRAKNGKEGLSAEEICVMQARFERVLASRNLLSAGA